MKSHVLWSLFQILYGGNRCYYLQIGKSWSFLSTSALGTVTWTFNTFNTGEKTATKQKKYPIKLYYIYLDGKIYVQTFKGAVQMPTIGGWGEDVDTGNVGVFNVSLSNGQIVGIMNANS